MDERPVTQLPSFHIIGGPAIGAFLNAHRREVIDCVRETYRLHHAGSTINPDSYFLRFPDKPTARIIALPARVTAADDVGGIKWISSFPENHRANLQRASAIVVLNDMATGFPYACLEGSLISAARTAASAAVAAGLLHRETQTESLAVIGSGPIASTTVDYLLAAGWQFGSVKVFDLHAERAATFCRQLEGHGLNGIVASSAEAAIKGSGLVLFATTAAKPHLNDPALFTPDQTVLHISLRDLGVPVIMSAFNVVDDVEHAMKAQTSVHLAEQATGGRAFVAGPIGSLIDGSVRPDHSRVRIFSPFGLGVLDLMLARLVYRSAVAAGQSVEVGDFFEAGAAA
jgi:2,3-diaminopropionate biosynthesis protein SbnB